MNNHEWKINSLPSNNVTANTGSQSIVHQFGTMPESVQPAERSFVNNTSIREYLSMSNSLKLEFDPPFRIKVKLGLDQIRTLYIYVYSSIYFFILHHSCMFFMQLNQEKLQKNEQRLPDLQLGLSHGDGTDDGKIDHCRETQEISTKLSLS